MDVLVYTQRLTPRVNYSIKFVFEDILGVKVRITSSYTEAKSHCGVLVSYCRSKVKEGIHVVPHSIMIEDSISRQKIDFFQWEDLPAFFYTSNEADIPFDIFAAIFYMISRYEEYLLFDPDKHSRFVSDESVASKGGFLEDPIVDQWVYKMVEKIRVKYPSFEIVVRKFDFIPTIDIDTAFAYQHKGISRAFLGTIKSLFFLRFGDLKRRISVYLRLKSDPFDIYDNLFAILKDWPNTIWFALVGKYGRYDKNIPIESVAMRDLLIRIDKNYRLGVHPSYQSSTNIEEVRSEVSGIVNILDKDISLSRQHYLRLFLPTTYRNLVSLGIKEDYSMGYSNCSGFRAGTCTPFLFYDLNNESVIDLRVVPFQTMDFTLCEQLKLTPTQAVDHIMSLVNKVKAVNGTFVSIWHNEYLSGMSPWNGWELLLPLVLEKVNKLKSEDQVSSA